MSSTRVARSRRYVNFNTPPELKAERKRKLQTMTPALYNELLANLSRTMRPGFCEPGEALNEAILIAMKKYNGEGSLKSFITRAAYLWALEQYKHYAKKQIAFTNLQTDQQFGDYLD